MIPSLTISLFQPLPNCTEYSQTSSAGFWYAWYLGPPGLSCHPFVFLGEGFGWVVMYRSHCCLFTRNCGRGAHLKYRQLRLKFSINFTSDPIHRRKQRNRPQGYTTKGKRGACTFIAVMFYLSDCRTLFLCYLSQTCPWLITEHLDTTRQEKWLFKQCKGPFVTGDFLQNPKQSLHEPSTCK